MSLRLALFSLLLIALLKQKTARPLKKLTFETTKEMVSFSLSTRKMHQNNFLRWNLKTKNLQLFRFRLNFMTVNGGL